MKKNNPDVNKKKYFKSIYIVVIVLAIILSACSNLDVQTLNDNAAKLMAKGDIDGAIARLESIQDLNPNFPQTNYNLGIAYKEKKELDKSVKYLEKSIKLKPDFYQAHLTLAVVNEELADKVIKDGLKRLEGTKLPDSDITAEPQFTSEEKQKLVNYYKESKKNMEDYLKYSPSPENKNDIIQKISEYEQYIKKYSSNTTVTNNPKPVQTTTN